MDLGKTSTIALGVTFVVLLRLELVPGTLNLFHVLEGRSQPGVCQDAANRIDLILSERRATVWVCGAMKVEEPTRSFQ